MIIYNYNNFLNEAKVSELRVGVIVMFQSDFYINNVKLRTAGCTAILKDIRKIPKQNEVLGKTEFDFFIITDISNNKRKLNKDIITIDSKRISKLNVIGRDNDFFKKIESGDLVDVKVSDRLRMILNRTGLYNFAFPRYSDISYIEEDKVNYNNITYIPADKIKLGGDIEKYRKSEKFIDVLKKLNPNEPYLQLQNIIDNAEKYYYYYNQLEFKIRKGILVKFYMSQDINRIFYKLNLYYGMDYSEITDLNIDKKDPEKITYIRAKDFKNGSKPSEDYRVSKKAEEVFKLLFPNLNDEKISEYAKVYKGYCTFDSKIKKGELLVFSATNEFMKIFTKLILKDYNKIRHYIPQLSQTFMPGAIYDIDYTSTDSVTYIPAIKYFKGKFSDDDREKIKVENFFKTYYDIQTINPFSNYGRTFNNNDLSKSVFEEDSIKNDSILYKEEVDIHLRIHKGEIAKYSASQLFQTILNFINFKVKGKYFDISSFDVIKTDTNSVSFIPAKRIMGGEKYRQVSKVGRVLRRLNPYYTESQIEKFSTNFKAELEAYLNPLDVQVVTGNKISYWYLSSRYGNYNGTYGGTLYNSCMRGSGAQNRVSFYNLFPDQIGLAVFIKNDKLYARALVWKCDDGKVYMDRVYFIKPSDGAQLDRYAELNNMYQYSKYTKYGNEKSLKVTLKNVDVHALSNAPYFDSFRQMKVEKSKNNPNIYDTVVLSTFFGIRY